VRGVATAAPRPPSHQATRGCRSFVARQGSHQLRAPTERRNLGLPFTTVGITYQQALAEHLVVALGELVTAAEYPEGGEGRIVRLG
jgi:hypothetical protein